MKSTVVITIVVLFATIAHAEPTTQPVTKIVSGAEWYDTSGKRISAHAGSILFRDGWYYWYGEHRSRHIEDAPGVRAYRSKDLLNWDDLGTVLPMTATAGDTLEIGCIIERPKVLFNAKTGKYVMWFHFEDKGRGYGPAKSGIAIADKPEGPFKLISAERPNKGTWPGNALLADSANAPRVTWLPEQMKIVTIDSKEDRYKRLIDGIEHGQEARDQTVFQDDDGKAYHIYSSEMNGTLHIAELSDDYLSHTDRWVRATPGQMREAPCLFKRGGKYYMITSACTGWAPNPAMAHVSDSIWGPWKNLANPWQGDEKDTKTSYESQGAVIFSLDGKKDALIYISDRWRPKQISDSRYIWQMIEFEKEQPIIRWRDAWELSEFEGKTAAVR